MQGQGNTIEVWPVRSKNGRETQRYCDKLYSSVSAEEILFPCKQTLNMLRATWVSIVARQGERELM